MAIHAGLANSLQGNDAIKAHVNLGSFPNLRVEHDPAS